MSEPMRHSSNEVPPAALVTTPDALALLIEELRKARFYAIDTEFHRERTFYPHLALVQVAWEGGIALIDPLATSIAPLRTVLEGPGVAVFHAADQDLEILLRACGVLPRSIFDTQLAAGFLGMSTPSLGSLVDRFMKVRLEKGDQLTDWTRRPLSSAQLRYAAGDVAYLLELTTVLTAELEARGRMSWAEAEFALLLDRSREESVPETAWWRLRQSRQLKGQARGIAQSLSAWRERRAREIDQPIRHVISDLAIVSIAQRPPSTKSELEQVRSMDGRHLQGGASVEILAAIEKGKSLSKAELMVPPETTTESSTKPAVALAAAWATERARQLEIDPAIFATRADLVAFLRDPPEGRLATSWRYELVGDAITRLISGKVSVVFDGPTLRLEERSHRAFASVPDPERPAESS